jgi:hypothetical protein
MRRSWLAFGLVVPLLAGCGALLGFSGDDSFDAGAADASADSVTTSEGSASSPDAGCDAHCLFFRDDFERSASNVSGPWTSMVGAPTLETNTGVGSGNALVASGGAGVETTFRESFLAKTLPETNGFELSVSMQANVVAGGFAGAVLDYCEFVSLLFGDKRVMLLYRDGTQDYLWFFAPFESGAGPYEGIGAAGFTGRIAVRVTWAGANISATVSRDGVELAKKERPLAPGEADAGASVRLGLRCTGTTPDMRLVADDVEIYAPP